ncbi:MAG: orotidine-5'-phosphate decarboxylase [Planctomycetes bacterium]|nr:orotidine-5'-phosphate decarboxylase [Planctomycetota bacterium]
MNYADRLQAAVDCTGNACLVGLDPILELLPADFAAARDVERPRAERARALGDFCCEVIDVVAGRIPAVKPQSAFFEALGSDGVRQFERVVARAKNAGLIVIADVKRGDIASTAEAYAHAFLGGVAGVHEDELADAVTLSPFLGSDSIAPFLDVCKRTGRGCYVLVRTSNKGSADFQRHGSPELSFQVADAVVKWGSELVGESGLSSVGAVVGATHGAELASFRERMPRTPFLLPGYGAQGAGANDVVGAFLSPSRSGAPRGALVNSSRGILFAHREPRHAGKSWKDATRAALDAMIQDLGAALGAR